VAAGGEVVAAAVRSWPSGIGSGVPAVLSIPELARRWAGRG
jgi:hypothetical protein